MITGLVRRHEAVIPLTVRGSDDLEASFDAVVDTGFTGELCLPRSLIVRLGLAWWRRARSLLADGSETLFDVHRATLEWDGRERIVAVDDVNAPPM